jgi:hypothetical protein
VRSRPGIAGHIATLGLVLPILAVAAGCAQLPASPTSGGSAAGTLAAGASSASPVASPAAVDAGAALRVVDAFERERAEGPRAGAWARLSPRTQHAIGTEADFERLAEAFVAAGGRVYRIVGLTQDERRLNAAAIGGAWPDVAEAAADGRAWVVDVLHPDVRGASAGSEVLVVSVDPTREWRIWIVH